MYFKQLLPIDKFLQQLFYVETGHVEVQSLPTHIVDIQPPHPHLYLHSTSSSLAERCCLHNIILISHDKCATMKLNIHHYPGALPPSVGRSSVNYWHRLSADNTSWGTAVSFHRNPIAEKKFSGCAQGPEGPQVPWLLNWAGILPCKATIPCLVQISAERAARAGSPACLHPSPCQNGKDVEPAMMMRAHMNPLGLQAGFPNCQLCCARLV